ncbi:MAG: hypothetical protein RL757_543 [Bacteroidota bacterium]|jgi:inhibitor of KinA sporulation pathway (predicted exonuclease)
MNYIVFDLECTCWKSAPPGLIMETIEIGAVKVDDYGEVVDTFQAFIRPVANPILSAFCRELTTITQLQVDRAKKFTEVIEKFQDWADIGYGEEYLLISWGGFDKRQLQKDCKQHQLDAEWTEKHVDLKDVYQKKRRFRQPVGMAKVMDLENMEFIGTPHRAINDAKNLTRVFQKFFGQWDI